MSTIDRISALKCLDEQWGNYVIEYNALPADEQQDFLRRQGYERFADLLAHFTAWWERGIHEIERFHANPTYISPPIDVDTFNAAAVYQARAQTEDHVIQAFEGNRQKFIDLIRRLSDTDIANPSIARQIEMELINHLGEHAIKKGPD